MKKINWFEIALSSVWLLIVSIAALYFETNMTLDVFASVFGLTVGKAIAIAVRSKNEKNP